MFTTILILNKLEVGDKNIPNESINLGRVSRFDQGKKPKREIELHSIELYRLPSSLTTQSFTVSNLTV